MNDKRDKDRDNLRSFLLMSELESGEPISQREIAGRLGVALGLVNSYLKALTARGLVSVKAMPRNRYAYLLTPKGFAEKSRLALQHLSNFNKLYRATRQDSLDMFRSLKEKGVEQVAFCGVDDMTEIAYLSLQEAGLELAQVMDDIECDPFFGRTVVSLSEATNTVDVPIVITSLKRSEQLKKALRESGVEEERILGPSLSYEEALS